VHAEGADGIGLGGVAAVDDEGAGEIGVEFGDGGGRGPGTDLDEHLVGGTFQGFAADDGADRDYAFFAGAELFADTRHGENRADADERIAGADDDAAGVADGFEDAGSGMRVFDADEMDGADAGLGAVFDEIFLKVHVPIASLDDGGNGLVGHGEDAGFDAESVTNGVSGLGQSFAMGQQIGAVNVGGEIAIAKIEPGFAAKGGEAFEEMKGFAAHAPSFGGIDESSECVSDDVQVRRNFQTVHNDIVAGVDDDGEVARIHGMV